MLLPLATVLGLTGYSYVFGPAVSERDTPYLCGRQTQQPTEPGSAGAMRCVLSRPSLDFWLDQHCYPSCPIPKTWKSARNRKLFFVVQIEREQGCGSGA